MYNILIVDDSNEARLKIRSAVTSEQVNVFETSDVDVVKNNSFATKTKLNNLDLIILDIQFKNGKDFGVLEYLKEEKLSIPVIVLSSNDRRETVLKTYRLGAIDYLLKPFDKQVLGDKVNYYLIEEDIVESEVAAVDETKIEKNSAIDYFKLNLLEEINRSIRSESNFSILKVSFSNNSQTIITKDLLFSLMRGIDQIYQINDSEYILLLPITDKDGAQILFDRLQDYLLEHLSKENIRLNYLLSFPKDIAQKVDQEKVVDYQHQIINKLITND